MRPHERASLFRELTVILREEQPVTLLEPQQRVALVAPHLSDVRPTIRGWRYQDSRWSSP